MNARRIVPYLTVAGGLEAIRYYKEAFEAKPVTVLMSEDGERVMHAELEVFGCPLMLADSFPSLDGSVTVGCTAVTVHCDFGEAAEADLAFKRSVEAGATAIMPAQDAFWGSRYARIRDPFGHVWSFSAPLKKVPLGQAGDGEERQS